MLILELLFIFFLGCIVGSTFMWFYLTRGIPLIAHYLAIAERRWYAFKQKRAARG